MRRFATGVLAASMLLPTVANAQSVGTLLGRAIEDSVSSNQMKGVCSQQAFATYFTGIAFGYYPGGGGGERLSIARRNALAEELNSYSQTDWRFLDWRGNQLGGSCHVYVKITITNPEYAQRFGVMEGDMYLNLERADDSWRIISITDQPGAGDNSFLAYTRPKTDDILNERARMVELARAEEARQQELAAEAARQEWIRTHPRAVAAQEAAEAARLARLRAQEIARTEADAPRRRACEANGGTWGRPMDRPSRALRSTSNAWESLTFWRLAISMISSSDKGISATFRHAGLDRYAS